ncbi:6-phosphogluconolactonase (cycloisomerase 2 family) [Stackebrandtia endophytica]|uniref:6-phosphogluconolactonase (Cycloisomerase 2 family) n=1 Tax=Stackebrandtia endophytica TaxID=1496996 RepID=A0A543B3G7_9ACTN|nr:lactonase family protein [Stackebrandtia endophytica]TQL79385.1 6-phosphogluconolactonase (cycloisomerase 2 family) [Stackebrandtia endophytica]
MRLILGSHVAVVVADPAIPEIRHRSEIVNPSYVTAAADGRTVYAVSEDIGGPGMVYAFAVSGERLDPLGEPRLSGGEQPCHAQVHPSGRFLLVANYGDGSVAVLPIRDGGELGPPSCVIAHQGSGVDLPRQSGPHAHQAVTDPSGQWVLVCDLGIDQVIVYRLDETTGLLRQHSIARFDGGQGIRHLAFSPDGTQAYVTAELSSELVECEWDAPAGVLTPLRSINTVAMDGKPVERNYPGAIVLSTDGSRAYVTNRGHNSIGVVDTALFELIGTRDCEGDWPRDAALSQDGQTLYVANENSGTLVWFDVSGRTPEHITDAVLEVPEVTSILPL